MIKVELLSWWFVIILFSTACTAKQSDTLLVRNSLNKQLEKLQCQLNIVLEKLPQIENKLELVKKEIEIQAESSAKILIASQVSHDIRSPLAALNMTIANLKNIPEQQRITLRAASNRINDIANTLLSHSKAEKAANNTSMKLQIELLPAILDTIVSEKRVLS